MISEKLVILVIEGDKSIVSMLKAYLREEANSLKGIHSPDEISKLLESSPAEVFDAIIIGDPPPGYFDIYRETPRYWLDFVPRIKQVFPGVPLIVFTNDGDDWHGRVEHIIQKPHVESLKKEIIAIKKKKEGKWQPH